MTSPKPKKWENRILASETSNNGKKFRKFRHFVQNNITHYNYYFNANEKIKTDRRPRQTILPGRLLQTPPLL
jgi:hypothetical protein